MAPDAAPVTIKRYGTARLYHAEVGRYVTAEDIAEMAHRGTRIAVRDAATGEDLTPSYSPIIVPSR